VRRCRLAVIEMSMVKKTSGFVVDRFLVGVGRLKRDRKFAFHGHRFLFKL
jgi:hypothetical protein